MKISSLLSKKNCCSSLSHGLRMIFIVLIIMLSTGVLTCNSNQEQITLEENKGKDWEYSFFLSLHFSAQLFTTFYNEDTSKLDNYFTEFLRFVKEKDERDLIPKNAIKKSYEILKTLVRSSSTATTINDDTMVGNLMNQMKSKFALLTCEQKDQEIALLREGKTNCNSDREERIHYIFQTFLNAWQLLHQVINLNPASHSQPESKWKLKSD